MIQMEFGVAVGQVLRRLRTDRGLTLHGVQELSQGAFKASALSGYERGERSISLEKFRDLVDLYSASPDLALKEVLALIGDKRAGGRVIDLTEASIYLTDASETTVPVGEG
jgi:transcriptional regulator with XRE-family HTH domain